MMKTRSIELFLNTPAFLGNAEQKGVWRTPPLKALLREWWRIAAARSVGYDHRRLLLQEGQLFGHVPQAANEAPSQSKLRLALQHWNEGKAEWPKNDPGVPHSEVKDKNTGKPKTVGSQLYLGYGPLKFQNGSTQLKGNAALQANDCNTLQLAWPESPSRQATPDLGLIPATLQLIDWFGTIGGRSRNGWGSLALDQKSSSPLLADHAGLKPVLRSLADCLKLDWPHAIGTDTKGSLVWESNLVFADWVGAMRFLATTKIGFRTSFGFSTGKNSPRIEARHLLAYPITNHDVRSWDRSARFANQLRFKLFRDPVGNLRARIYHTPHACPLPAGGVDQLATWQKLHNWLDQQNTLTRLGASK